MIIHQEEVRQYIITLDFGDNEGEYKQRLKQLNVPIPPDIHPQFDSAGKKIEGGDLGCFTDISLSHCFKMSGNAAMKFVSLHPDGRYVSPSGSLWKYFVKLDQQH